MVAQGLFPFLVNSSQKSIAFLKTKLVIYIRWHGFTIVSKVYIVDSTTGDQKKFYRESLFAIDTLTIVGSVRSYSQGGRTFYMKLALCSYT